MLFLDVGECFCCRASYGLHDNADGEETSSGGEEEREGSETLLGPMNVLLGPLEFLEGSAPPQNVFSRNDEHLQARLTN